MPVWLLISGLLMLGSHLNLVNSSHLFYFLILILLTGFVPNA